MLDERPVLILLHCSQKVPLTAGWKCAPSHKVSMGDRKTCPPPQTGFLCKSRAHQDVWSFEICMTLRKSDPELGRTQKKSAWCGLATAVFSVWGGCNHRGQRTWALAQVFLCTPFIPQGPGPITHPFTICLRPPLPHAPLFHLPRVPQSLEQAAELCLGCGGWATLCPE